MSDFFILKINQFSLEMNVCVADQVYARCSDGIAYIGTVTEVDPIRNEVQVKVWFKHTKHLFEKSLLVRRGRWILDAIVRFAPGEQETVKRREMSRVFYWTRKSRRIWWIDRLQAVQWSLSC